MATCGLPDPRPDHALCIARFAIDCIKRFATRTKSLEVELGPDTGEYNQTRFFALLLAY